MTGVCPGTGSGRTVPLRKVLVSYFHLSDLVSPQTPHSPAGGILGELSADHGDGPHIPESS